MTLRLANASRHNKNELKTFPADERFEVLSLVGTLSQDGVHLHISLGDADGKVWGGHLVKATGEDVRARSGLEMSMCSWPILPFVS